MILFYPFLYVRGVTLCAAFLALAGFALAMHRSKDYLRNLPMLAIAAHGLLYYGAYLLVYFHPALLFNLQTFADWGSVLLFQIYCTLALIAWDIATDFFTGHFWPFLQKKMGGGVRAG